MKNTVVKEERAPDSAAVAAAAAVTAMYGRDIKHAREEGCEWWICCTTAISREYNKKESEKEEESCTLKRRCAHKFTSNTQHIVHVSYRS